MKKDAESRGAEEAPISRTLGMELGRGVVSRRTAWLNLWENSSDDYVGAIEEVDTHRGCRVDIVTGFIAQLLSLSMWKWERRA